LEIVVGAIRRKISLPFPSRQSNLLFDDSKLMLLVEYLILLQVTELLAIYRRPGNDKLCQGNAYIESIRARSKDVAGFWLRTYHRVALKGGIVNAFKI
jgi:hypothetical protein